VFDASRDVKVEDGHNAFKHALTSKSIRYDVRKLRVKIALTLGKLYVASIPLERAWQEVGLAGLVFAGGTALLVLGCPRRQGPGTAGLEVRLHLWHCFASLCCFVSPNCAASRLRTALGGPGGQLDQFYEAELPGSPALPLGLSANGVQTALDAGVWWTYASQLAVAVAGASGAPVSDAPLLSGIYVAVPLGYALRVRCARRADRGGYQPLTEEPLLPGEA